MSESTTQFHLVVVSPTEVVYEGNVERLIAPGTTQDIANLPDHTPLYSQLSKGNLEIMERANRTKTIAIEGGIIRVKLNQVSVIVGF